MKTTDHFDYFNLQLFAEPEGKAEEQEHQEQEQTDQADDKQQNEKTFTQADVDRMIAQRLSREKKEIDAKIKAAREEGRSEAEKLAKMTEQQRLEHEREQAEKAAREREANLVQREKDIAVRELKAQAMETLREKKLSLKLADVLDYSSADACNESISRIEAVMREAVQESVDARIAASRNPLKRGGTTGEAALMSQVRSAMGLKESKSDK